MPYINPTWNEETGYTGDNPFAEGASGWGFDENKWTKFVPSTAQTLNSAAIQGLTPYSLNTEQAGQPRFEVDTSKTVSTDPNAYYSQLTNDLVNTIWKNQAENNGVLNPEYNSLLESIKDINPAAYYNAQVQLMGNAIGHYTAMGDAPRKAEAEKSLSDLLPEATKAGVTQQQLNNTLNSGFSSGATLGQNIKSAAASSGDFWGENLMGALKVGSLALGAYGLDTALGAGLGALDSSAIAAGGSGGGGAFVPTAGSSFAIAPEAAYTTAGLASSSAPLTTSEILSSTGFTPTAGSSFTIDPTASYTTANLVSNAAPYAGDAQYEAQDVMQQARDTNVPSGSPTSWDTGITPSISASDVNNAAKLAKALAGSQTTAAAQNLATGQTGVGSAIPALLRTNQNPFLQTAQQPIRDTQPMDLSSLAQLLKQG